MTRWITLGMAGICLGSLRAGQAPIGLLPTEKTPVAVAPDERNPFGKRAQKLPEAPPEEKETEESKIRAVIERLKITGVIKGTGGVKVLLGSIVLQVGQDLPPVVPNQTERVRVVTIEDAMITMGFVEKDETADSRMINRSMNLEPEVRYALADKSAEGEKPQPEGAPVLEGVVRKNAKAP